MAPKVKYTKDEIIVETLELVRTRGIEAVTARDVAVQLNTSPRPIFTWFDTMDELKLEVFKLAEEKYRRFIEKGLKEELPVLGICKQSVMFARKEPELYRLLFLNKPIYNTANRLNGFKLIQSLARSPIMQYFRVDARQADGYFHELYFITIALSTLSATGSCPYTDAKIKTILTEIAKSISYEPVRVPGQGRTN